MTASEGKEAGVSAAVLPRTSTAGPPQVNL